MQMHFDAIAADDFQRIVAKCEIAHDEQFLRWPQCFQLYLTIKLSFMEIFQVFVTLYSKSSAADFFMWEREIENIQESIS